MKRRIGQTLAFAAITALCGLLIAGLLLPLTVAATSTTNAVASASLKFPARMPATTSPAGRSELLFADGTHLAWFFDRNRVIVPLSGIAPVMRQAQLAIENHRFYQQGAVDLPGLGRALVGNLATDRAAGGGSGITQQYVKMLRIEQALQDNNSAAVSTAQERTLARKVEELRYAVNIEQLETKDQILAGYLNLAYYGDGAYGIEAAAEHYFSRHATQLTLPQAALLAGIVKSPTAYNPLTHPSEALRRRNTVLNRMAQLGMITRAQAAIASRQHFDKRLVRTIISGCEATAWPFLCDAARRELLASPELGATPAARRALLYRGSLTIRTTID